ncbi:hypothetical protein GLGR_1952 [Leminorella grimontii ATCC 33999 = DSM 5078]|nr:hypothetical protein GLGR_1952 [Leminorella grimontii ATCC 33999 = DSM 5078]
MKRYRSSIYRPFIKFIKSKYVNNSFTAIFYFLVIEIKYIALYKS